MPETISLTGWPADLSDSEMTNLEGSVLSIVVGGVVGPNPTPLGEFFRFGRVTKVDSWPALPAICPRCGGQARWQIVVRWEAGYVSPDGNIVCEGCVWGRVTDGVQFIAFDESAPRPSDSGQRIAVTFDLTKPGSE